MKFSDYSLNLDFSCQLIVAMRVMRKRCTTEKRYSSECHSSANRSMQSHVNALNESSWPEHQAQSTHDNLGGPILEYWVCVWCLQDNKHQTQMK